MDDAPIIHDFLCYNNGVEQNYSVPLEKSLDGSQLELLHLLAHQAGMLHKPLYIAGGVVRDLLLGRPLNDFDLVVEGDAAVLAEAILKKFGGRVIFHARFGTATWILDEITFKRLNVPVFHSSNSPTSLDLISARSETYSQPGALPTVQKSTIDDDLRRRDFTINAMAIRLDGDHFGELFDPLGGQKDIENKLIRVLHPISFVDDPTRMFRAVRYAARYGFEIESETLSLINDEARAILSGLSGERLRHEFDLVFEEPNPSAILKQLADLDLLKPIHSVLANADRQLPTIEEPRPEFGEFAIPDILTFRQSLGWVLFLMNSPEADIEAFAERLAFPASLTKAIFAASTSNKKLSSFKDWKPSQLTFYLDELPSLAVYTVYLVSKEQSLRDYLAKWQHVKPHITGDDLKKRGLEPGPRYGEILRQLRAAWLDGDVSSKDEEMLLLERLAK